LIIDHVVKSSHRLTYPHFTSFTNFYFFLFFLSLITGLIGKLLLLYKDFRTPSNRVFDFISAYRPLLLSTLSSTYIVYFRFHSVVLLQALCFFGPDSSPMRLVEVGVYSCASPPLRDPSQRAASLITPITVPFRIAPNGGDTIIAANDFNYYSEARMSFPYFSP
jgi:hypothetical protein